MWERPDCEEPGDGNRGGVASQKMLRDSPVGLLVALGLVLLFSSCGDRQSNPPTSTAPVESAPQVSTTVSPPETITTLTAVPPPPLVEDLLFVPESFRDRLVELVEETQQLRGLFFDDSLSIETVTTQEMARRLRARVEDDPDLPQWEETLYKLLGLVESESDWAQVSAEFHARPTPAFYDVSSQKLWLISTLESPTPLEEMTLVGEVAKALVDRHLGIWERRFRLSRSGDSDLLTVLGAIAEADSTLVELLFAEGMTGESKQEVVERIRALSAAGPALPTFMQSSLRFSSGPALDYLQRLYQLGGWDLINDGHRSPPDSTEQILVLGVERPEPVLLPRPGVAPPEGYREIADSVWGQWGWNTLLASVLPSDQASSASFGWAGDRYLLFSNGADVALVVDYRGDTIEDTQELRGALEAYIPAGMDVGTARAREAGLEYYAGDYAWLSEGEKGEVLTFIAATDVEVGRQLRAYRFG